MQNCRSSLASSKPRSFPDIEEQRSNRLQKSRLPEYSFIRVDLEDLRNLICHMRQKRQKAYRKLIAYYGMHFAFRAPLQVLVCPSFVQTGHHTGYDLESLLQKTLGMDVKVLLCQCTIGELYTTKSSGAIGLAKSWERRRCGHIPPETIDAHECLQGLIGTSNKNRYILACEDETLRQKVRTGVPGVPMLYFNRGVLIMEPASQATKEFVARHEREKLLMGREERPRRPKSKVKRKLPQPNPMAVRKKQRKPDLVAEAAKRRRRDTQRIVRDLS